jgi:hypothetical protein
LLVTRFSPVVESARVRTLVRLLWYNSYVWLALATGALLLSLLARDGLRPLEIGALALFAALAAAAQRLLRPRPRRPAALNSLDALERALRGSRPTLLELYSPRCVFSFAHRSDLERLERALGDRLQILRLDASQSLGAQVADQHGVLFTPSYLLFSAYGMKEEEFTLALDRSRVLYWLDQQTITP